MFARFSDCGYGSLNFFENIGSVALFQHIFYFRMLLNPICSLLFKLGVKSMNNVMGKLRIDRISLISQTILVVSEFYFELLIGSLIAVDMLSSI